MRAMSSLNPWKGSRISNHYPNSRETYLRYCFPVNDGTITRVNLIEICWCTLRYVVQSVATCPKTITCAEKGATAMLPAGARAGWSALIVVSPVT